MRLNIPGERHGTNIFVQFVLHCCIEKIGVIEHKHAAYVKLKFVLIWLQNKRRDRSSHLEEAVTHEFETLVVWAHAGFEIDLFFAVLVRVLGIFSHGLQRQFWSDVKFKEFASVNRYQIALESVDYGRKYIARGHKTGCELYRGQYVEISRYRLKTCSRDSKRLRTQESGWGCYDFVFIFLDNS